MESLHEITVWPPFHFNTKHIIFVLNLLNKYIKLIKRIFIDPVCAPKIHDKHETAVFNIYNIDKI